MLFCLHEYALRFDIPNVYHYLCQVRIGSIKFQDEAIAYTHTDYNFDREEQQAYGVGTAPMCFMHCTLDFKIVIG